PTNYGSNATRTVVWTVNDGSASSNTAAATTTLSITAGNDAPTLTNVPTPEGFHLRQTPPPPAAAAPPAPGHPPAADAPAGDTPRGDHRRHLRGRRRRARLQHGRHRDRGELQLHDRDADALRRRHRRALQPSARQRHLLVGRQPLQLGEQPVEDPELDRQRRF